MPDEMSSGYGCAILACLRVCEYHSRGLQMVPAKSMSSSAVRLFLNAIVSGKVAQKGKVRLVDSLSALARDIDIAQ